MSTLLDRENLALVVVAALVVVFLAAGAWFLYHPPLPPTSAVTQPVSTPPVQSTTAATVGSNGAREVLYGGQDGATVLDLLKQDHRVRLDTELLLFGSIVLEIDSVAAKPDEYWVFYRDTTRGDRSPEACTTRTGETIRWVLKQRR
jgi:hypothetical protein